jgi:hypothetical protein
MSSSKFSSTDEDFIADLTGLLAAATAAGSPRLFASNELQNENQNCIDATVGVSDYFATVHTTPYLFQTVTGFTAAKFEDFCQIMCPIIVSTARSTCLSSAASGQPPKLIPEQRLLSFVMHLQRVYL